MSVNAAPWPIAEATLTSDGTGTVSIGGIQHPIQADNLDNARAHVITIIADRASQLGRPVRTITRGPDGEWGIIISPDKSVTDDPSYTPSSLKKLELQPEMPPETMEAISESVTKEPVTDTIFSPKETVEPLETTTQVAPVTQRELRQSFLTHDRSEAPATKGWQGLLSRIGIRIAPSQAERSERADIAAVSQHWPGPRTIAIVNGKGGAGKTPTTVCLSAVFARYGGAGVLAWDNNQTRGTLGWRTEQGPHEATLLELLPQAERLLGTGAQSADLAHYVHHQTHDRFDVLRSKPMELASVQRVHAKDVDSIHDVASKYYRLIFIDSGNDESDPMWQRMVDHADQLVVATTTRDDHAEAGALLLEALTKRDTRSAHLAEKAVVVVTQADSKAPASDLTRVAKGYSALARSAITIPFDPAMVDGLLRYGSLRPTTQRTWLRAAAAVAQGL